jgi:hypothetical protein
MAVAVAVLGMAWESIGAALLPGCCGVFFECGCLLCREQKPVEVVMNHWPAVLGHAIEVLLQKRYRTPIIRLQRLRKAACWRRIFKKWTGFYAQTTCMVGVTQRPAIAHSAALASAR